MTLRADQELLQKFARGELDSDGIARLEERLDAEPDLQRELGALVTELHHNDFPENTSLRSTLCVGRARAAASVGQGFELGEVIGRGGIGLIRLAEQRSLARAVAVKVAHDASRDGDLLIEEALVTGFLEHPNIVPVHDILLNERNEPMVVLKRIEGRVWRDTLDDPTSHTIEWHIRVLIQVCQALRFAHSRDIIHRDIKPANVMIGEFDEVYLLDWGLGLALNGQAGLPSLSEALGMTGTPAYMAPEQLGDEPALLGFHTDVYLVGACLYHVAVGHPPQRGHSVADIREAIDARARASLPDHVPPELGAIIQRAMAVDPADRYASIAALRDALDGYLEHRTAISLTRRGDVMASEMARAYAADDDVTTERAFFDAAFNYRAAVEQWPEHTLAADKLDALVRARVEQLIEANAPSAARRALAIVQSADAQLHAKVDAAVAKQAAEQERLRDYERGDDRAIGLRTKRYMGLTLGGAWIALCVLVVALPVRSPEPLLVGTVASLLIGLVAIARARHVMLDVRLNRYLTTLSLLALVFQVVLLAVAVWLGRSAQESLIELMLLWSFAAACIALVVDTRILVTAIVYAAAHVICRIDPTLITYALPGGAVVMVATSHIINMITSHRARRAATTADPDPDSS